MTVFLVALAIVAYLVIGTIYGAISWNVWGNYTYCRFENRHGYIDSIYVAANANWQMWLLFPLIAWAGELNESFAGMIARHAPNRRNDYLIISSFFWPLRVAWSVLVLAVWACYSILKYITLRHLIPVLKITLVPLVMLVVMFIKGFFWLLLQPARLFEAKKSTGVAAPEPEAEPVKIESTKIRIADILTDIENKKQEIETNAEQIRQLRTKNAELAEQVFELEQQQAALEGDAVYRAPRISGAA